MLKALFLCLFFGLVAHSFCQNLTNKRYVKTDSFDYEFYVSERNLEDFQVKDSLIYYWCKSQKLLATQGGFGGRVIDGSYSKFYPSGQLAEKGIFKMGLKHGVWKTWYRNGVLRAVCHYRNGKKHGLFTQFDEQGLVLNSKKYLNDKPKQKVTKTKDRKPRKWPKKDKVKEKESEFWERFRSRFKLKREKLNER